MDIHATEGERTNLCNAARTAHDEARSALISSLSGADYYRLIADDYRAAAVACTAVAEAHDKAADASLTKIERILAMPIIGNAHHDGPLLVACGEYATDESNAMEDRIAALEKINATMGVDYVALTAADVAEYVAETT